MVKLKREASYASLNNYLRQRGLGPFSFFYFEIKTDTHYYHEASQLFLSLEIIMGIKLSKSDKLDLVTQLSTILKEHECHSPKYVTAITHSLTRVLETNSRWMKITENELIELSIRYSKKIPEGNFKTNFGKILVRRFDKQISREYFSESNVIKGWHKELLRDIRGKFNLNCSEELSSALFELGQYFIIKEKA